MFNAIDLCFIMWEKGSCTSCINELSNIPKLLAKVSFDYISNSEIALVGFHNNLKFALCNHDTIGM